MLPLIFTVPLTLVALGLIRPLVRILPRIAAGLMLAQLAIVAWVCTQSVTTTSGADFGLDGVGAAFLVITTLVAAAALGQAALLLPAEHADDGAPAQRMGMFYTLSGVFLAAMYAVLLAQNFGYLWIAMEITTLASAPLVYYHRSRHALEASWKYLLLCSVGIAFALFGTVLLVAAQHATGAEGTLRMSDVTALASHLDPRLLRLAFIFCLLGYGTKAGLFPLHNWLPDAHSESPAPTSAMLSGALLNCALVAIWRVAQVMQAAGQGDIVRQTLVPAGAITVLAAGIMLVRQSGIKRLWAYSSVEHVGLLTLAIGIGATPLFLLHALNHSVVKVALFLLAGGIMHVYGTKSLKKISGLLEAAPAWGVLLAAGAFAIAGTPPFGTFLSEWLLLRETLAAGHPLAALLVIVGLTIAFVAIATHVGRMLFGPRPALPHAVPGWPWAAIPATLLVIAVATGLALAPPVMAFLTTLVSMGGVR
jgi:hydrogenase-4 component F